MTGLPASAAGGR